MKKSNFFFLFLLLSAAAFAQDADTTKKMDPEAAKFYNKGIESLKAASYTDAVAYFDSCLQKVQDPKFYQQRGFAYFKQQKFDAALKDFQEVLKSNPNNDVALALIARTYYDMGNLDEAIKTNKTIMAVSTDEKKKGDAEMQIATIQSEQALSAYNKGIELYKAGKNEEALASYQKSFDIKKDFKPIYQMGIVYQKMQKSAEAIKMFEQSVALNSTFGQAYIAMASVHYMDKDFTNAIADYEKAVSMSADEQAKTSLKEKIGLCYFQMGLAHFNDRKGDKTYEKAIESFTKGNEANESDLNWLFLARCQAEKKLYDVAIVSFDKALSLKKTVTEGQVAYYKGTMFKNKGDVQKALEQFKISVLDEKFKKASDSEIKYFEAKAKQDKDTKKK